LYLPAVIAIINVSIGLVAVDAAHGDQSFNITNLTPANGSTIAYSDWSSAGRYVTFTIQPDSQFPCGGADYWLIVNGHQAAQFSNGCTASVLLATPGQYSWQTDLYDAENGILNGPVSTFTIELQPSPPTTSTATPAPGSRPSLRLRPPALKALTSSLAVNSKGRLFFKVSAALGSANLVLRVFSGRREIWRDVLRDAGIKPGVTYHATWRPSRVGMYRFCILARDAVGNRSATSCAAVSVN
jgi:hypothetical protein